MNPDDVLLKKPKVPSKPAAQLSPLTPIYVYGRLKDKKVLPYVKFRDMNNCPGDDDNKPVTAAEIGIRISF